MGLFEDILAQVGQSGSAPAGQSDNKPNPLVVALQELLKSSTTGATTASNNAGQSMARNVEPASSPANSPVAQDTDLLNGLNGLLQKLQAAGLGDVIKSWVGPGQNAPVAPKDLGSALGQDTVRKVAGQAGINSDDLLTQLSKALPGFIDGLTPNGRLPNMQEISDLLRKR